MFDISFLVESLVFYILLPGGFVELRSFDFRVSCGQAAIRGGVQQRDLQEDHQGGHQVPDPREHRGQGHDLEAAEEGAESEAVLGRGHGPPLDQE